ncbi:TRAP transporter small permease [Limnobacter litoralis]|uniref:TRAP transporter small permease protein n=1 Tax=Limnobacter litoralis TaxID=481366 RepID=A0ABQ5YNX9_9BURK|nr:TRAP transporter small permease [Limnobacter litoralis]GLR25005.1 C4-dicarboxylate ABC transporter [Limnobacter litoralis]
MSHGFEMKPAQAAEIEPGMPAFLMPLARLMLWVNKVMVIVGMLGLLAASLILTYGVVGRFLFNLSTDWQDEASVFCLVGATFLSGAFVQSLRGHIGIEAVAGVLPKSLNKLRFALVDVFSLGFCAFFTWKSWTLFHEAFVDGQTTSSTWAPPLSIPYGLMAMGMTLLTIQLTLQAVARLRLLFIGSDQ